MFLKPLLPVRPSDAEQGKRLSFFCHCFCKAVSLTGGYIAGDSFHNATRSTTVKHAVCQVLGLNHENTQLLPSQSS